MSAAVPSWTAPRPISKRRYSWYNEGYPNKGFGHLSTDRVAKQNYVEPALGNAVGNPTRASIPPAAFPAMGHVGPLL